MADPKQPVQPTGSGKKTLIGIVGAIAASWLMTSVPEEESGRKVEVTVKADQSLDVRHISGKQYLQAYKDIAGIPTICDGITRGVKMGQKLTEAQCGSLLETELVIHADAVMDCTPGLRRPGMDYQRFAAVSLAYNIGTGAYCQSSARRLFNAGKTAEACDAFLLWNKATVNGRKVPVTGLSNRRKREREACLTGVIAGKSPVNLRARMGAIK